MKLIDALRTLWLIYVKGVPEGMLLVEENHPYCICWRMYASDYDEHHPGKIKRPSEAPTPPEGTFAWNHLLFKTHAVWDKRVNGGFKTAYPCIAIGDKVGFYRIVGVNDDRSARHVDRASWDDGVAIDLVLVKILSREKTKKFLDGIYRWRKEQGLDFAEEIK